MHLRDAHPIPAAVLPWPHLQTIAQDREAARSIPLGVALQAALLNRYASTAIKQVCS